MQLTASGWRCPWVTATRFRLVGSALACAWPRGKPKLDPLRSSWSERVR